MGRGDFSNKISQIILVGARGAGKTTIGHALARTLDLPFYDTDRLVEELIGEPIAHLWKREGESSFRKKESEVVAGLSKFQKGVVATGGGVVLDPVNRNFLRDAGVVFYISLKPESLVLRLQNSWGVRPRLMENVTLEEEVRQVQRIREPFYRETADFIVDANGQGISQVVQMILKQLDRGSTSSIGVREEGTFL
ncbi:MAG: shikimate kinase [Leptospirales bacterium]